MMGCAYCGSPSHEPNYHSLEERKKLLGTIKESEPEEDPFEKEHEHDWKPDGDSWTEDSCDWSSDVSEEDYSGKRKYTNYLVAKKRDKIDHYSDCDGHNDIRKRRYTCHCGESKIVKLRDGDSRENNTKCKCSNGDSDEFIPPEKPLQHAPGHCPGDCKWGGCY